MKTFTLRLSDTEAEILERLNYILGPSKNKSIARILKDVYQSIDPNYYLNGTVSDAADLAAIYYSAAGQTENISLREADLLDAFSFINYAIEHAEKGEEAEELKKEKEALRKNILLGLREIGKEPQK